VEIFVRDGGGRDTAVAWVNNCNCRGQRFAESEEKYYTNVLILTHL